VTRRATRPDPRTEEPSVQASPALISSSETKLTQIGIRKIIPEKDLLSRTYEAAVRTKEVQELVDRIQCDTTTPVKRNWLL